MNLCSVSNVKFEGDSLKPLLVNFENGSLQEGYENNLHCELMKNSNNKLLLAAITEKLVYTGPLNVDDLYNNFIAIRNTKTNKIKVIAVDNVTLSTAFHKNDEIDEDDARNRNTSVLELHKQFGSKRSKRQTAQIERMKMNVDNVKEQLENTVAGISINEEDLVAPTENENESLYRPAIYRKASKLEDVYQLDKIVLPAVLDSVTNEVARVLKVDASKLQKSSFITKLLLQLQESSSSNQEEKCKILLYVDCLINMMVQNAKVISQKKFSACTFSDEVNADILQKFTIATAGSRQRPNTLKDKTLCYIMVLLMLACNYQLDLELLAKDVKTGLKKLQDTARILAFTPINAKNRNVMVLKLPLPPAVVTNMKNRRK